MFGTNPVASLAFASILNPNVFLNGGIVAYVATVPTYNAVLTTTPTENATVTTQPGN